MLGKPKYHENDLVEFQWLKDKPNKVGIVYIVDKWGTFSDNSDVSYDILVKEKNMLYKHISERYVVKYLGNVLNEEK
jgi:hypothetical protein